MNKSRRKEIAKIIEGFEAAIQPLHELSQDVESVKDEEEETFDNMPEGLQSSENGERVQAAVDALSEAHSLLEDLLNSIEEITGLLETAAE